jgi:hypothetical protein
MHILVYFFMNFLEQKNNYAVFASEIYVCSRIAMFVAQEPAA